MLPPPTSTDSGFLTLCRGPPARRAGKPGKVSAGVREMAYEPSAGQMKSENLDDVRKIVRYYSASL